MHEENCTNFLCFSESPNFTYSLKNIDKTTPGTNLKVGPPLKFILNVYLKVYPLSQNKHKKSLVVVISVRGTD